MAERERCRKVGIPEGTPFRTKPALALELIDQLLGWELEAPPVLADVAYGNNTEFRQALAARSISPSGTRLSPTWSEEAPSPLPWPTSRKENPAASAAVA